MTDEVLDGLLVEAKASAAVPPPPQWPSGASKGVAKVSYTHDAMIDLIIANPTITQNQLAAQFGYTAGWVSQIIASDAFQAKLAERTSDLVDPTIRASVDSRFKGLVLRSLEILQEKLNKPANQIPDNLALRTFELSSRAAGYGARDQSPAPSPVSLHLHLDELGSRLTDLLRRKKAEVLEGEIDEAQTAKG